MVLKGCNGHSFLELRYIKPVYYYYYRECYTIKRARLRNKIIKRNLLVDRHLLLYHNKHKSADDIFGCSSNRGLGFQLIIDAYDK